VAIFMQKLTMKSTILIFLCFLNILVLAQPALELKEIMKGQDFTGYWPESPQWNLDGSAVYFRWNKDGKDESEPYRYNVKSGVLSPITELEMAAYVGYDQRQANFTNQLSLLEHSLVLTDRKTLKSTILFQTDQFISDINRYSASEATLRINGDFYALSFNASGMQTLTQLTRYVEPKKATSNDSTLLQKQQTALFEYIRDQQPSDKKKDKSPFEVVKETELPAGFGSISGRFLDPLHRVVFIRTEEAGEGQNTLVPQFITASGYVRSMEARAKVSKNEPNQQMYLHALDKDTMLTISFSSLSDIRKKPSYMDTVGGMFFQKDRSLFVHDPIFAINKPLALLDVRAADNKDRWIVSVNLLNGEITELEHQHDEAWIGGPGINEWNMSAGILGFVQQDEVIYFQSEENGFSQLYELNLTTKKKELVYPGGKRFEISEVMLSKDGTRYFVVHNANNPRALQGAWLHRIHRKLVPVISNAYGGFKDLAISPNEQQVAYLNATANAPWELFIGSMDKPAIQLTKSQSPKFSAYPWKTPEYITFKASDGINVYARLYQPTAAKKNGAAVLFVHGAGYLQNAHAWWSHYYREYMFHNLLVDQGYTVLDVDYRASAGYGRDYRTAVYRHMGGRDVQDYIDSKKFLSTLNIDTNRVGIYGGSYGGFVTLMSLFQHPDAFACGAALRSVTDWAHYNHEYTSNILNYPETDPSAYKKSSPIYYAEGLNKPLLMLHGMVDDNVQFQDIVRLQQRLIELGKTNWELAAYPVEAHGFQEAYSWYDEYRRIYELFQKNLIKK
jgi:acetyl esterase/lipase